MLMNRLFKTISLASIFALAVSCDNSSVTADYNVIPAVEQISGLGEGYPFELNSGVEISYTDGDEAMQRNAQFLADYLKKITGDTYEVVANGDAKGNISLKIEDSSENIESYTLKVSSDGVVISAPTAAGVFYGIQTLRKSMPATTTSDISLPSVEITDAPRFAYRGVHLDVARHFYSMDDLKKFIDMMALHNMNRFHWHLTEDQGWRLEIKRYPLLTEIGSKRKETVIGGNTGEYDGKPYGGFYTQEEAKELVAYAAERQILVIPEIDLPGHVQAALAAYPNLGCTGGPYEVWTRWGVSDNVLCAGNDEALQFIDDVLAEVIEIFPSEYIHIGGDECPKTKWQTCKKCQARIKALGLKGDETHSKEEYLQSFVINHAEKFVNSKGRKIIGWDEILEGGLSETATVMSWRGEAGGIEAAKMGNDVIMTPNTFLYFDYYQSSDIDNEPLAIGGFLPIKKVYNYEPMPESLTEEQQKHIIGVQANHWSEYYPTYAQVEYMALPRWAALAEVQWSGKDKKDYSDFLKRLPRLIDFYDVEKYNYATHIYDVETSFSINVPNKSVEVVLETLDDSPIYYTLDGSDPTKESTLYEGKFPVDKSCEVKAVTIRNAGASRIFSEDVVFSKSTATEITANQPVNKQYEFSGISTLVDGLKGGRNYKTGHWIAFYTNDMDVTIDLKESKDISTVSISTCVEQGDWIFDARSLSVEVSEDGKIFNKIASEDYPAMKEGGDNGVINHKLSFDTVKARYVKVYAESEQSIPAWHGGKGKPGFMFVDEIVIE